jgi:hypothetical protein
MAERAAESTVFSLGEGARIGKIDFGGHVADRRTGLRRAALP